MSDQSGNLRGNLPVRPEQLLQRAASDYGDGQSALARASRATVLRLMDSMVHDHLEVVEGNWRGQFGADVSTTSGPFSPDRLPGDQLPGDQLPGDQLKATIVVEDERAWVALLREGSIGLGRGYIEQWWHSDNPVDVVRIIIRNLRRLDEVRNQVSRFTRPVADRIRRVTPRAGRETNREDISAHYDLGNSFFELFLDPTLTYSSGIFPNDEATMEEASLNKYDVLIDSLGLSAEHHLLEIGTGWGGMAIRAVERTGCRVTSTTISQAQLEVARRRVDEAGFSDRITLLDSDWRDLSGQFDRVVSIEMIEAVDWRDYDLFFSTIERCLKPDGLASLQAICVPDRRYERTKNTEDYIRRFIFPGGFLPSIGAVSQAVARATGLQMVGFSDFGAHYAETLRRWRHRFDERADDIEALGLDERFRRVWRFYLAYCEAGFLERHCTVNHIHLAGSGWRGSMAVAPPAF